MTATEARRTAPPQPRRTRRPLLLGVGVLLGVLVLTALAFAGLRAARPGALPGTTVNGVLVGGLEGAPLRAAVEGAGADDVTVRVLREDERWDAAAAELGYTHDVDATVERVLARGRQGNPLTALADHLEAFRGTTEVPPVHQVDENTLSAAVEDAVTRLSAEPVEGTITISGTTIDRVDPAPGAVVDSDALASAIRGALLDGAPPAIDAPFEATQPQTTTAAVDAVQADAERAVSDGVELTRDDVTIAIAPEDIGDLLRVEQDGADLLLSLDVAALAELVPTATVEALATAPTDARFSIVDGTVQIADSADGFAFDPEVAGEQLLALATGTGPRSAPLEGEILAPALSTDEARALNIVERVSSFTTEHACCEGRVTNIQRMADTVNGTLIQPGETFSLNDHVGERTTAKGYVGGGAIYQGEFVEQVGGGVSQFTTTMFNAAFFGGYAIPDHKAHSYYISRYPVGREATLNYPTVDLKIRNNSPHGILVTTSYTATSISVSFWGTKWVDVTSITGERRNLTSPEIQTVENRELPPGTSRVTSEGRGGFDITVTRVLSFPDGREEREEFFTRYLAEPRVTERNSSPPPPPRPTPAPPPEDAQAQEAAGDAEAPGAVEEAPAETVDA